MRAGELLEQLSQWNDGALHSDDERFFQDWIGNRSDSSNANNRPAGTILWDAVRVLCDSPDPISPICELLDLLKPLRKRVAKELKFYFPRGRSEADSSSPLSRSESSLDAHFNLAELALRLKACESETPVCIDTFEKIFSVFEQALYSVSRIYDVKFEEVPKCDWQTSSVGTELRDCRALNRLVLKTFASSGWFERNRNSATRMLLVIDRALNWLLTSEEKATSDLQDSRQLYVGLVNRVKTGDNFLESGTHAKLKVTRTDWPEFLPKTNQHVLVPDLVYQGLMLFDQQWHEHFDSALLWAQETAESSEKECNGFRYSLNYIADKSGKENLSRAPLVEGGSASLAAAVAVRALLEERPIYSLSCLIGAIKRQSEDNWFGTVEGLVVKFESLNSDRILVKRIVLVGLTPEEEKIRTQLGLDRETELRKSPQEAYELLCGQFDAIRAYERSELSLAWQKLGSFLPWRVKDQLVRRTDSEYVDADFKVLEKLTMPQPAKQLTLVSARPDTSFANQGVDEESKPDFLNTALAQFVGDVDKRLSNTSWCLKIVGGPGMGKTFFGWRIHHSILKRYEATICGKAQGNRPPLFPVWVTFRELQSKLEHTADTCVEKQHAIISEIVCSRIQPAGNDDPEFRRSCQDSMRWLIKRHLEKNEILLIVDAWEERKRDQELAVAIWLNEWFKNCNPGVMTSRQREGVHLDPLPSVAKDVAPWMLLCNKGGYSFCDFAEKWFGNQFDAVADKVSMISKLFETENQSAGSYKTTLTSVPQVAAIICWLIDQGVTAEIPHDKPHLLKFASEEILKKHSKEVLEEFPKESPECKFAHLVELGLIQDLVSELAYRSFDGDRWLLNKSKLKQELNKISLKPSVAWREIEKEWGKAALPHAKLAELIINCGLFTKLRGDGEDDFEIIHNEFAHFFLSNHRAILKRSNPAHSKPVARSNKYRAELLIEMFEELSTSEGYDYFAARRDAKEGANLVSWIVNIGEWITQAILISLAYGLFLINCSTFIGGIINGRDFFQSIRVFLFFLLLLGVTFGACRFYFKLFKISTICWSAIVLTAIGFFTWVWLLNWNPSVISRVSSPPARLILSIEDTKIQVNDLNNRFNPTQVGFGSNNKFVFAVNDGTEIRCWDVNSGKEVSRLPLGHAFSHSWGPLYWGVPNRTCHDFGTFRNGLGCLQIEIESNEKRFPNIPDKISHENFSTIGLTPDFPETAAYKRKIDLHGREILAFNDEYICLADREYSSDYHSSVSTASLWNDEARERTVFIGGFLPKLEDYGLTKCYDSTTLNMSRFQSTKFSLGRPLNLADTGSLGCFFTFVDAKSDVVGNEKEWTAKLNRKLYLNSFDAALGEVFETEIVFESDGNAQLKDDSLNLRHFRSGEKYDVTLEKCATCFLLSPDGVNVVLKVNDDLIVFDTRLLKEKARIDSQELFESNAAVLPVSISSDNSLLLVQAGQDFAMMQLSNLKAFEKFRIPGLSEVVIGGENNELIAAISSSRYPVAVFNWKELVKDSKLKSQNIESK